MATVSASADPDDGDHDAGGSHDGDGEAWKYKPGDGWHFCKLEPQIVRKHEHDFCSAHPDMEMYVDAIREYRGELDEFHGDCEAEEVEALMAGALEEMEGAEEDEEPEAENKSSEGA